MRIVVYFLLALALGACNINSNIMLKDSKNVRYSAPPLQEIREYRIAPFDQLTFRFYKNNGFEILGVQDLEGKGGGASSQSAQMGNMTPYYVEADGNIKLPYLGKVNLVGKTVREAEAYLEERYGEIFVKPFIILNVINRRVIVSTGNGNSSVVQLSNTYVSVLEALALAGGVDPRGKVKNIKVIRRTAQGNEIYRLNLRTLDGLAMANMPVEANDIIYVEPRKNIASEIAVQLAPYLTLLSTAVLVFSLSQGVR
ncbi:MAG TPA: polysaccharide biosynthesis/export family protein [Luteibaculaceae bacterium]|nr:polysaccharide biosynthesis/export family protein [Luteibaculaceae bacterium]